MLLGAPRSSCCGCRRWDDQGPHRPDTCPTPLAYILAVRLEWDEAKNIANQRKHGVSFKEVSALFAEDVDRLCDEAHSALEERFISIGPIQRGLVLVVWTERSEDVIRGSGGDVEFWLDDVSLLP